MWYRVKIDGKRKFIDERVKAELGNVEIETKNKWLEGVVNELSEEMSDGEVINEIIKLIDNGECWAE